jgi:hypothetical protein
MTMNDLVSLLLYLLVGGLIVYVVYWILGMVTLPAPAKNVILIIVAVIVILWLLRTFGLLTP